MERAVTDTDLETEVALALAKWLDECPDPECRCVSTDRGTDTLGCDVHDPEERA